MKSRRGLLIAINTAGLISKVSEKWPGKSLKIDVVDNLEPYYRFMLHLQGTSANIRINFILPGSKVIGLHFLLLIVWVDLHSNFCKVRNDRLRSSKVVDFGTNRKGVCNFLLVINSNFGPILRRFWHIYSDLLTKNYEFFLPHSHLTSSLWVNSFEFLDGLFTAKTSLWVVVGENFVILACVLLTQCQRVIDGRTDRRTNAQTDR